tara:strand:- start:428 stop:763 length:336 start_codon:yes stop_codon:yes gene_type:complete
MAQRYDNRNLFFNKEPLYDEVFEERNVDGIRHYSTATMKFPTADEIQQMIIKNHVWSVGDRYYKLAIDNYGDASYWWVIAMFNQRPTEANWTVGEIVQIPLPLERFLTAVS